MQAPLLKDTHAWIWYAGDQSHLDRAEWMRWTASASRIVLFSDFSLWEFETLVSLGRLTLDRSLGSMALARYQASCSPYCSRLKGLD